MTAIIGVACSDGVVIGADSSATLTAGQVRTIEQSVDKLDLIDSQVIVAGTGQGGLGQRFCEVVRKAWRAGAAKQGPVEFGKVLSRDGINDFATTMAPRGQYGALVAFPCAGEPHLCEFAISDFQPELKTEKFWYVSMGSGQPITDPFLGFIREIFWESGRPTLQEGIFAVTWALEQAIQLNPGGVNGPICLGVLERVSGAFRTRRIDDDELGQHRQNVAAAKTHLREFRLKHHPGAADLLPAIPRADA